MNVFIKKSPQSGNMKMRSFCGQANKAIVTGSTTWVFNPLKDPIVQTNDANRVQKLIFPIYP